MTISEINALSEGMHIDRVEAVLNKVYDREDKTDKKGRPYTLQNGYIKQDNDSIKVSFFGHKDLKCYEGKVIIIRSVAPKSFVSVSKYKDKAQLTVPGKAIVLSDSEESDAIPMEFDEKGESITSTKPQSQPKANVEPKKAIPANGVNVVKHRLMQMANFRALCDSTVDYLYGEGADAQLKKDVSSCFFIHGLGEGLEKQLPDNKPLSKKENDGASEPEMAEKDVEF